MSIFVLIMSTILCIETSANQCSVSIGLDGKNIHHLVIEEIHSHSKYASSLIEEVLKDAGIRPADLDAVAISGGPGSYTGLRIGASLAKGLSFGLDLPFIAINTLKLMAYQAMEHSSVSLHAENKFLICACIDARRMEVYTATFNQQLEQIGNQESLVIDGDSFAHSLADTSLLFVGSGASKIQKTVAHPNALFLEEIIEPSAAFMPALAYQKWLNKEVEDAAYYTPNYIKPVYITPPKKQQ